MLANALMVSRSGLLHSDVDEGERNGDQGQPGQGRQLPAGRHAGGDDGQHERGNQLCGQGTPLRSPPAPETASRSCSPSTATAFTAATTSSTSRSTISSSRLREVVRARPWKASGYTDRATGNDAVRYTSVTFPPRPLTARRPRQHQTGTVASVIVIFPAQEPY